MSIYKDPQVYTAQPQSIFIKGFNVKDLCSIDENEIYDLTSDELKQRDQLRSFFLNSELTGQDFIEEFKCITGIDRFTGFSSLMARNLKAIVRNLIIAGRIINDFPISKDDVCYQSLVEKLAWHEEFNEVVPVSFGKIIHYGLTEHYDNIWGGPLAVCTFFDNKVYDVRMEFYHSPDNPLKSIPKDIATNTFPGVPDFGVDSTPWNFKLHAKSGAFKVISARENGIDMDPDDDIFQEDPGDCFDMFFADLPPQASEGLPPQLGYCMGRCDDRFINSSE